MRCPGLGGDNEEAGIHRFYSLQRGARVAASRAHTAPVIGFMSARPRDDTGLVLQAFLKGLGEAGFSTART
jgi:hypothetical protein